MKIPRITIKFDVEKNLYNVWETCNDNNAYGHDFSKTMPKQIVKLCKNKKFEDCKKELKCRMLSVHSHPLIEPIRKFLDFSWSKISKEYFQRLEKIIGKQFYSKEVIIY
ncbi:MAG: hypothetical protein KKF67_03390, partial [Nanoarchaeota archaeon]|nr:hypothetical protein [Nanoarchaeota archaeon]